MSPAAGLAHYGRRFDDFVTEIVVLETRVANHAGDLKATRSHATMLRQSVDTLPAVGDLAGAAARLDAVVAAAEEAMSAVAQDRATARAEALARREALCAEAEQIAESSQWKTSGDRLKEIVEEWRTIRGLDRRTDDQLWKRFSKARDTFIRRRGSHFAELDKERAAVREVKEKLIARAEELADSSDWAETASKYRDLMAEWKAAGRTSRDLEDALWMRFRDAQERFFSRRQQTFASRDAEFEANATPGRTLLAEAEKIDPNKISTRPRPRCVRFRRAGRTPARCRGSGSAAWTGGCGPSRTGSNPPRTRTGAGPTRRPPPGSPSSAPATRPTRPRRTRRRQPVTTGGRLPPRHRPTSGWSG